MKTTELYLNEKKCREIIDAHSFALRLRGLIGRDVNAVGGLLLRPCSQIHTCFMGSAIDVIYLDKHNTVLRIDTAVAPWRCCRGERGARSVLELPPNTAGGMGITVGGSLSFR